MWQQPRRYDSAMDSPLLARPWTPPETEPESSPRSDCFSDAFRAPDSAYSSFTEHRWPLHQDELPSVTARCDTPTESHRARPKPVATHTAPALYTPTKSFSLHNATDAQGAPQYPYTPDSSRILRRNTERALSPMPWDDYSDHSSSPVQHALSSCIAHFENLIQTRQPDEDQMEYIVGQFEAMASYLSAPEAQTKATDEHLFSDPEHSLGLASTDSQKADADIEAKSALVNQEYVAEVGRYIDSVKKYIEDLKMRLDEVKTLNSIQLDVIYDLRRQMRTVRQGMRSSLSMRKDYQEAEQELDDSHPQCSSEEETALTQFGLESWETIDNERPLPSQSQPDAARKDMSTQTPPEEEVPSSPPRRRRVITIIRKPENPSFWSSFADALDQFGDLLFEY